MMQQRQRRRWNRFPESNPIQTLFYVFVIWKALLLLITELSPGLGYDTSTLLLLGENNDRPRPPPATDGEREQEWLSRGTLRGVDKLVRWDAIYFAKIAERGYLFEQEWAFGWGFTRLIALLSKGAATVGIVGEDSCSRIGINVGITISHAAHLFSTIVLYRLTELVFMGGKGKKLAFIASILHIITPAGVFLSAPYAESLFAALNFVGHLIYTASLTPGRGDRIGQNWRSDLSLVLSGAVLGLATAVRSNGLLNGILYLYDFTNELYGLLRDGISLAGTRKAAALGLAGILVGLGTVTPQRIAYLEYCAEENSRPWCRRYVPSVYAWVQDHYWNVGFMRYWTFSNLPLFLLAAPMLSIMVLSAIWALHGPKNGLPRATKQVISPASDMVRDENFTRNQLRKFAVPQFVLAVLALTTYHVQIVTRISSGYMTWYWWLAFLISEEQKIEVFGRKWNISKIIIRWMVVYAVVQGGLFASFLPPA